MANGAGGVDSTQLLEQYKSLVGDVASIGTRYATANGFYLSVLTALLGVLAYVGAGKPIDTTSYPVIMLVAAFAVVICFIWHSTIVYYGKLFGAKFAVLKHIESNLSVQVYAREDEELTRRSAGRLTDKEVWVPRVLGTFFSVVFLIAVILLVRR